LPLALIGCCIKIFKYIWGSLTDDPNQKNS
jgi:hypothetical protein